MPRFRVKDKSQQNFTSATAAHQEKQHENHENIKERLRSRHKKKKVLATKLALAAASTLTPSTPGHRPEEAEDKGGVKRKTKSSPSDSDFEDLFLAAGGVSSDEGGEYSQKTRPPNEPEVSAALTLGGNTAANAAGPKNSISHLRGCF